MGASTGSILGMMFLQVAIVGVLGYGLGVGGAVGVLNLQAKLAGGEPSFRAEQLAVTAVALVIISAMAAIVSSRKVIRLEPAMVFRE